MPLPHPWEAPEELQRHAERLMSDARPEKEAQRDTEHLQALPADPQPTTHTHTLTHTHTHTHTHKRKHIDSHMLSNTNTYTHTLTQHTRLQTHIDTRTYTHCHLLDLQRERLGGGAATQMATRSGEHT